ncbi:MAG: hypothetical protein A2X22_02915 [Bacteroidetes bacterium GWF2_49_14]|nr:MAG: hypothetical protein A2X22_02915 [Bacteroidetes bacterium GWF2_49_14]
MKNLFKYFFGILIFLVASTYQADSQQIFFNKIPPPDGKTFVHVTGITQDVNGYMWLATKKGLCRYDGYQMTTYKNNPLDPNSPATDVLETICVDSTGIVWIGTSGAGIDRFDPSTGLFKHFRHNPQDPGSLSGDWVTVLMLDHEGILWVGTGLGLDRYDEKSGTFKHFRNNRGDSTSISSDEVEAIYEDRQGILWVGTGSVYGAAKNNMERGGLNRMNKKEETFTHFMHDPRDPNSLINNKVRAIFEDSKGTLWIGTAGDGLHTMDRTKGTFTRHQYDPKHPEKLSRPPISRNFPETDHITFIREDAAGAIWIGTTESGINYYNPKTTKTTHFESEKDVDGAFTDRTAWWSFSSRDGVLWISTLMGNLYRIDPLRKEIPHYTSSSGAVNYFYQEQGGILWLATDNGIIRKDVNNEIVNWTDDERNLSVIKDNWTSVISGDDQGNILIGQRGLYMWNAKNGKITTYKNDAKSKKSISNAGISAILEDKDEKLWIGTFGGLNFLDLKTGNYSNYLINPVDTSKYGQNSITAILRDKTDKLWIGSLMGGGLNLFNEKTGEFKNYLNVWDVNCLYEDSSGTVWVGSNDGLYKYDLSSDKFILYSDSNTKAEISSVLCIVEDNQSYLWLATTNGIVRINPQRNETSLYAEKNKSNENGFKPGSGYKGRNGAIYFGDGNGYYAFNPAELTRNIKAPGIIITNFSLADHSVKPGSSGPLKESLLKVKEIRLRFDQNVFSFDFAGLDYANPVGNRHLFMLENYDKIWHRANSEHRAYYFNVPPGKYVFRVKVANSYGVWAEKKIAITILPPWWGTWWAYVFYGLLFLCLVFLSDRIMRKRLLEKERAMAKEKELEQAKEIEKAYHQLKTTQSQLIQSEKMASLGELTAGIAHEIQNPLNFVNNFSEVSNELVDEMNEELDKGDIDVAKVIASDIKQNLEKILHHGKRADAIVKGMLQHSRSSSGMKEPTDINHLADEYLRLSYHGLRAKDKSFNADFKTDFDPSMPKISVIPQDIGRVLLNLINNAFYAVSVKALAAANGHFKPTVIVSTKKLGSYIEIRVKDNGNGIPDDILGKVFQPFFTTKPTGEGTGLGLSLSYDIVKAHGGELKVETKEGEGSTFMIQLPLKNGEL